MAFSTITDLDVTAAQRHSQQLRARLLEVANALVLPE